MKVLPRKDLNNINKLWLKYSNGRFGFSVQKRIWKRLGGGSDTTYNSEEIQEKFGDEVGWRKEGDWVYYSDIYYSRTAPSGHLPICLMLNSEKSERCDIDFEILEVIVGRIS
ncbi:GUN4 domain-containing protein [Nostoc sp. CALU 1950]|uniref:GUN4 domain-containing protein n=1 Tax=Nostoc sp. CALU 1950 TaxID=3104321 RepID=UPI003EBC1C33